MGGGGGGEGVGGDASHVELSHKMKSLNKNHYYCLLVFFMTAT